MTNDTPNTPTTFNSIFITPLFSRKFLVDLLVVFNSLVMTLSILMVLSSLGSRLTIFACCTNPKSALPRILSTPCTNHSHHRSTYVSRQQAVDSKSPPFTLIIRPKHNGDVLDADHKRQGPDNQGEGAEKIIVTGLRAEG